MSIERLIEQNRYINVDYDWWDCEYDCFREDMAENGITVESMSFSGFYCQSDYARFKGCVDAENMRKFMEAHNLHTSFPHTYIVATCGSLWISIKDHHYYGMQTEVDTYDIPNQLYDEVLDPLRAAVYEQAYERFDFELNDLEAAVKEVMRGYAHKLYTNLLKEYEYLTSDEAVKETLEANDMLEEELEDKTESQENKHES